MLGPSYVNGLKIHFLCVRYSQDKHNRMKNIITQKERVCIKIKKSV